MRVETDDTSDLTRAATQRAQARVGPKRLALGCDGDGNWQAATSEGMNLDDVLAWNDRLATPASELARVGVVLHCLETREWFPDASDPTTLARYARCGADARRLDRKALDAELAAGDYTAFGKAQAIEAFARAALIGGRLEAAIRKDAALTRVLITGPEAGWKAWEAGYAAHTAAIDAALAYEDAYLGGSKKARKGCGAALQAGWAGYLEARAPKDVTTAEALAQDDAIGLTLYSALIACDVAEARWLDAMGRWSLIEERVRDMRGPRAASAWAAFDALLVELDDRDSWVLAAEALALPRSPWLGLLDNAWANQVGYAEAAGGEIKAIAKADDGAVITFKKVTVTRDITECEPTNRLWGFDAHGNPIYEQKCRAAGKVKDTIVTEPVLVPAHLATKLAVGQVATFAIDTGRETRFATRHGFPTEVWKNAKLKVRVMWKGVALAP